MVKIRSYCFYVSLLMLSACGGGQSKLPETMIMAPQNTANRVNVSGTVTIQGRSAPISKATVFITSQSGQSRVMAKTLNMECPKPSVNHSIAVCTEDNGSFTLDLDADQQYTLQIAKGIFRETLEINLNHCSESDVDLGNVVLEASGGDSKTTLVICGFDPIEDVYDH